MFFSTCEKLVLFPLSIIYLTCIIYNIYISHTSFHHGGDSSRREQVIGGGGIGLATQLESNSQGQQGDGVYLLVSDDNAKLEPVTLHSTGIDDKVVNRSDAQRPSSCLSTASTEWLCARRYSNVNVVPQDDEIQFPLMIDHRRPLLESSNLRILVGQQSLCRDSPFQSFLDNDDNTSKQQHDTTRGEGGGGGDYDDVMIHNWRIRLIYVSIFYHQHRDAILEMREREELMQASLQQRGMTVGDYIDDNDCSIEMRRYNVSTFDFECANSKFLVAEVRSVGIGSLLIWDMTNMIMAAFAMNRTLVLYNNIETNGRIFSPPWKLSSCDRKDLQCSFQPFTACSLTISDIIEAKDVKFEDYRNFLYNRNSNEPIPHNDTKVIRFNNRAPIPVMGRLLKAIHATASNLINALDPNDRRIPLMRKAAASILEDGRGKTSKGNDNRKSSFIHAEFDFVHAFIMYALRPTLSKGEELEKFYERDVPSNLNSTRTLGLPIRGSDKCNQESECLQPSTYMRLMGKIWSEHGLTETVVGGKNAVANILVTSEAEELVDAIYSIASNDTYTLKLPFKPNIISNSNDIHQRNGNVDRPRLQNGAQADDIVTSILSSFKLQMKAGLTVGNCCSNFHQIIFHLLRGGCGVEPTNRGMCLQDRNESIYQLCCDKGSSPICPRERLARLAEEFNRTSITVEEAESEIWEEWKSFQR